MPVRVIQADAFVAAWQTGAWETGGLSAGRPEATRAAVTAAVTGIITRVRTQGQAALTDLTKQYDHAGLDVLEVMPCDLVRWAEACPAELRMALGYAAGRIRDFARRTAANLIPRLETMDLGGLDGAHEAWCALSRVGLYVPGGRAPYPSSVLMTAIPAREAGVGEVVLCTPPRPDGSIAPAVAAAAILAGVDRVFRLGGAQAIAAMAIGAGEVPRVDKIAGPGNVYVTEAKRQLYGQTGFDGLAGPSEVVAVSGRPGGEGSLAWQLLAQAEHDPDSLAVAVLLPGVFPAAVLEEVAAGLGTLPAENRRVAGCALAARGALVTAGSLDDAVRVARAVAPEHLWIDIPDRDSSVYFAKRAAPVAGAVFFGPHSPVALGDYAAGPSHVLPTAGSARWASPLGPAEFMRRVSLVAISRQNVGAIGQPAEEIARAEGFAAHATSLAAAGGGDGGIGNAKLE